jgi:hypothetical protein
MSGNKNGYNIVRLDGLPLTEEDLSWIKENILKFIPEPEIIVGDFENFESEPE